MALFLFCLHVFYLVVGSQDLIEGRHHLVMGLVWQIIKMGLFAKVDLLHHPELFRLLEKGETLEDLLKVKNFRLNFLFVVVVDG